MKLHRFYVGNTELEHNLWLKDEAIVHQWQKVLRFQPSREVSLFDDKRQEKLYRIIEFGNKAAHLEYVTDMQPQAPKNEVYLCFSLLKKDKNNWVLQKATELGVSHFVPLLCSRTEKTGFDHERALKIVTEAAEQCGRVDVPRIREPITPEKLIEELSGKAALFTAEQGAVQPQLLPTKPQLPSAVLIGPEGGWTDTEKHLFKDKKVQFFSLSDFTLRAETAAIAAAIGFCC